MRWKGQGAIKIGDGTSGEPKLFSTFFRVVAICRKSIHCPEQSPTLPYQRATPGVKASASAAMLGTIRSGWWGDWP